MPNQGGTIQLLPESRRRLEIKIPGENRPVYYGLAILALAIIIFAGFYTYASYLNNKLSDIDSQASVLDEQRDKKFEKELMVLDKRFAAVNGLIQKHIVWSNALIKIQNLTPPQVQFDTLFGDVSDHKVDLKARAASYTVIARQIASLLSDESITGVNLSRVTSLTSGLLEYDMQVLFNKDKFLISK